MHSHPSIVLYASQTSPFVRRVKLALKRAALLFETRSVDQLFPPPEWYSAINPLGLIPALTWGDSPPLFDSSAILDFLDDHTSTVWPKDLEKKWIEKRFSTTCAGLMLDAVGWRLESVRPDARASELQTRSERILQTLNFLGRYEQEHRRALSVSKSRQGYNDLCVALDYLSFRLPHLNWSGDHSGFADLLEEAREEESFSGTDPRS